MSKTKDQEPVFVAKAKGMPFSIQGVGPTEVEAIADFDARANKIFGPAIVLNTYTGEQVRKAAEKVTVSSGENSDNIGE